MFKRINCIEDGTKAAFFVNNIFANNILRHTRVVKRTWKCAKRREMPKNIFFIKCDRKRRIIHFSCDPHKRRTFCWCCMWHDAIIDKSHRNSIISAYGFIFLLWCKRYEIQRFNKVGGGKGKHKMSLVKIVGVFLCLSNGFYCDEWALFSIGYRKLFPLSTAFFFCNVFWCKKIKSKVNKDRKIHKCFGTKGIRIFAQIALKWTPLMFAAAVAA